MGTTVTYDDDRYDVPDSETVREFKQRTDFPEEDILTYLTDDMEMPEAVDDDEMFSKVPNGATVAPQADGTEVFG